MENASELKSCPFCGSEKIRLVIRRHEKILNLATDYFYQCWGCGCALNTNTTKEAAKKRWNTRTPSPESKHKCQVCSKEAFTDQKSNGWRCQDHVLFGQSPESSDWIPFLEEFIELNPANYNDDDVRQLLGWSLRAYDLIKLGTQQSKLVPLDVIVVLNALDKDWQKNHHPYSLKRHESYDLVKYIISFICSNFGSPAVPSVEEIEHYLELHTPIMSHERQMVANAIHRLLTNGKEEK